jgi:prephenate dehydrogenase
MPVTITLIGLNRLSASIGLALRPREGLRLVGFDRDNDLARVAQSRGMVHSAEWNLINAVTDADLVLLAGRLDDQREWFKAMAPELRQDGVVATLAPVLGAPLAWATEALPAGRHFVATHPILNPAVLFDGSAGLEAARADLFEKGLFALAPAPNCAPEALKLLNDLATLLNAQPYFVDAAEHDGVMAGVDAVPTLLAAALLHATNASPGWSELRKAADRGFANATLALADVDPSALTLNRDNTLRYLDAVISELQGLREHVAQGNAAVLGQLLTDANERRARWLAERMSGEWEAPAKSNVELPSFGETVGRMLTGGLFKRKKES